MKIYYSVTNIVEKYLLTLYKVEDNQFKVIGTINCHKGDSILLLVESFLNGEYFDELIPL